ncbi:MAG: efflux RND transporter periplasmic adaptor subunit [Burkholderiales bacterium]|nr:efflux RND transporter periplasmic adaptor subunit [Burkholderiales bacterium]
MTKTRWQQAASWAVASGVVLLMAACGKAPVAPEPVRAVRTLVLSDTGGTVVREFAADIHARTESRLGFRVPGKVTRRLVELGQTVREGQVLAQLDPQDLQLGQEAARAGVAAAEANAAQASADLKRFTELKAQGFISAAELDRHVTMAKSAESALRQAKAQAGVQGNQAAYAALTAPSAGVITTVDVEQGQVVGAGQPVLVLAHDGPRDAVFAVPESMAKLIRPLVGKKDAIKVKAWGTDAWVSASIREMAAAADPVSRTFLAKADVGLQGFELGQTASVSLVGPVHAKAGVRVPVEAVAERDGKSVVWVLDAKQYTVQPQIVMTGDVTGDVVLVVQGLKPGQEIVTAGAHVLSPGQKVRRYQEPTAAANKS